MNNFKCSNIDDLKENVIPLAKNIFTVLKLEGIKKFSDFYDGSKKVDDMEYVIGTKDCEYVFKLNFIKRKKHTCVDCIYNVNGECGLNILNPISLDKKIFCSSYTDKKRCWDCVNQFHHPTDDYCMLDDNDVWEKYYFEDYNVAGDCPHFRVEL